MKKQSKVALALDEASLKILKRGFMCVWQEIGHDVMDLDISNAGALELCIDADRLAQASPEAYDIFSKLRDSSDYPRTLYLLNKKIKLV